MTKLESAPVAIMFFDFHLQVHTYKYTYTIDKMSAGGDPFVNLTNAPVAIMFFATLPPHMAGRVTNDSDPVKCKFVFMQIQIQIHIYKF